jgi:hypothetical protein
MSLSPAEAVKKARSERLAWIKANDTREDPICRKNCLDVCVDYNNRVAALNPSKIEPAPKASAGVAKRRVIPILAQR